MDNDFWLACSFAFVVCVLFGVGCLLLGSRPDREDDDER